MRWSAASSLQPRPELVGRTHAPTLPAGKGTRRRCSAVSTQDARADPLQCRSKSSKIGAWAGETGGAQLRAGEKSAGRVRPGREPACTQQGPGQGHSMLTPTRGRPDQSNGPRGQRSTCWVISWEGLGRKRLNWCGGPPGRGYGRDTQRG